MNDIDALDRLFAAASGSPTLRAVFVDEDSDADADPLSFVTRAELDRIADRLGVKSGDTILDVGCGRGGPGLAIARRTGASLVGVDRSPAAIASANARGAANARFEVADWSVDDDRSVAVLRGGAGVPPATFDGAVSFDALQLMPARAALERVARVLKPGARFAFTTWELAAHVVVPPQAEARVVRDWRALLSTCGFVVENVNEPSGWRERQLAVYRRMRDAAPALKRELGEDVATLLLSEASEEPARIERGDARRVLAIARRETQQK